MSSAPQGLSNNAELTWLSLKDNQINSLAHLAPLRKLHVLNAGGNRLVSLEGVEQLRELRALILNDNLIADTSCVAQLRALPPIGGFATALSAAALPRLCTLRGNARCTHARLSGQVCGLRLQQAWLPVGAVQLNWSSKP